MRLNKQQGCSSNELRVRACNRPLPCSELSAHPLEVALTAHCHSDNHDGHLVSAINEALARDGRMQLSLGAV